MNAPAPPPGFKLTHVALRCGDLERSVAFYRDWCGLTVIHRREDSSPDRKGTIKVAWLGRPPGPSTPWPADFWIVLLEMPKPPGATSLFDHLGFDAASRAEVDAIAARAQAAGILHWPAEDLGHVVGYLCSVKDPDGNVVEFSHGQTLRSDPRKGS
ncbi:MAG: VOC family protein [Planctomycetota bacterium]|nr:VOC family protein [Planctomycetota bacterium]